MNRIYVPVKHEYKKAFFVALREAVFIDNNKRKEEVKSVLKSKGLTDTDIANKEYFHFEYFRNRVDRRIPPPSVLYPRVRAVLALYGGRVDSRTNKPLFTDKTWDKANELLREILSGNVSDPPG